MLHPADVHLLSEARARGERYRSEALEHARVVDGRATHLASGLRGTLASGLARLARLLAAVAEDLDPQIGRPSWQPRA
jgi:hypothetical protein